MSDCPKCGGPRSLLPCGVYTCRPCNRAAYETKARAKGIKKKVTAPTSRDEVFARITEQGLGVDGGLAAVQSAAPQSKLTLRCPEHGAFQLRLDNLKKSGLSRASLCLACMDWGLSREAVFSRLAEQGISVEGGLEAVRSVTARGRLTLTCAQHGAYQLRLDTLKQHWFKQPSACPQCNGFTWTREAVFEKLTEQGLSVDGGLAAVQTVAPRGHLTLTCGEHGTFKIGYNNLTSRGLERPAVCPSCGGRQAVRTRLLNKMTAEGLSVTGLSPDESHAAIMGARLSEPLALTCARHGEFELTITRVRQVARKGASVCPHCRDDDVRWPARLQAAQKRCDEQFGAGVVDFGTESYLGHRVPRTMRCLRDPAHGEFSTSPATLLAIQSGWPCPRCRLDKFSLEIENQGGTRRTGGYIYVIVDAATSLRYYGLTTLTPERRFAAHMVESRNSLSLHKPLYKAMNERPDDFSVVGLAYYFDVEDLAAAERQIVEENNSLWPNGYNLIAGGNMPGNLSTGKRMYQLIETSYAAYDADYRARVRDRVGQLNAAGMDARKLKLRLENAVPVENLEDELPRTKTRRSKYSNLVIDGQVYTRGLTAACKELGVDSTTVSKLMTSEGIGPEAAIELAREKAREYRERLTVRYGSQVFRRGIGEACAALQVCEKKVRSMVSNGLSREAALLRAVARKAAQSGPNLSLF